MSIACALKHTYTIARYSPPTALGFYGDESEYLAQEEFLGFGTNRTSVSRATTGERKSSPHVFYTRAAVDYNDRIWVPGADISDEEAALTPSNITAWSDPENRLEYKKVVL